MAIASESFLPQVNGVSNTVRHVAQHLVRAGHQPLVGAPGPGPSEHDGVPVVRVRSLGLPGYKSFPLGLPDAAVERAFARFRPDVVHLASPIVLGAVGLRAARRHGIPTVAVYQTDIAGFARHYGVRAEVLVDRWVRRLHRRCSRTLVPSSSSYAQLEAATGAHVVALLTAWEHFRALDPCWLGRVVERRAVVDARHALDVTAYRAAGWSYRALGRPAPTPGEPPTTRERRLLHKGGPVSRGF